MATQEFAVTMCFGILLFSHRKWKGFLRSVPRKRATTVTLTAWKGWEHKLFTVKWNGNSNIHTHGCIWWCVPSQSLEVQLQRAKEEMKAYVSPEPQERRRAVRWAGQGSLPWQDSVLLAGFCPLRVTWRRFTNWGWSQEFSHWHLGWRSSPDKFRNTLII